MAKTCFSYIVTWDDFNFKTTIHDLLCCSRTILTVKITFHDLFCSLTAVCNVLNFQTYVLWFVLLFLSLCASCCLFFRTFTIGFCCSLQIAQLLNKILLKNPGKWPDFRNKFGWNRTWKKLVIWRYLAYQIFGIHDSGEISFLVLGFRLQKDRQFFMLLCALLFHSNMMYIFEFR